MKKKKLTPRKTKTDILFDEVEKGIRELVNEIRLARMISGPKIYRMPNPWMKMN